MRPTADIEFKRHVDLFSSQGVSILRRWMFVKACWSHDWRPQLLLYGPSRPSEGRSARAAGAEARLSS